MVKVYHSVPPLGIGVLNANLITGLNEIKYVFQGNGVIGKLKPVEKKNSKARGNFLEKK